MNHEEQAQAVTVAEVKALLAFASHKNERPHLEGICICSGGLGDRLAATDAYTLAIRGACPRDKWQGRAVGTSLWKEAIKGGKATDLVTWEIVGDVVTLSRCGNMVRGKLLPKDFPNVAAVIPAEEREPVSSVALAAGEYLSRLALVDAAEKSVTGRKLTNGTWRMSLGGELDPILLSIDTPGCAPWTVVIMPIRM